MINFYVPKIVEMSDFKKKASDDYDIDEPKFHKTQASNLNDQEDCSQIERNSNDD